MNFNLKFRMDERWHFNFIIFVVVLFYTLSCFCKTISTTVGENEFTLENYIKIYCFNVSPKAITSDWPGKQRILTVSILRSKMLKRMPRMRNIACITPSWAIFHKGHHFPFTFANVTMRLSEDSTSGHGVVLESFLLFQFDRFVRKHSSSFSLSYTLSF